MIFHSLYSDHSFKWSVSNERLDLGRAKAQSQETPAQPACARFRTSRLLDRALQTLWQSKLQVRTRSRPWAKDIPHGELPKALSSDGLRPPGQLRSGQPVRGQLRPGPRDFGGGLRDQSRTVTSARAALRCSDEPDTLLAHRLHRRAVGRDIAGQYAHRHDRQRASARCTYGGQP
jgi:hypothetical protein